jgi:hypothetical protein
MSLTAKAAPRSGEQQLTFTVQPRGEGSEMLTERLLNAGCMGVLAAVMAVFNPQIGEAVTGTLQGDSTAIGEFGVRALQMTRTVNAVMTSYAGDNTTMVLFAGSALVLLGLMFRN